MSSEQTNSIYSTRNPMKTHHTVLIFVTLSFFFLSVCFSVCVQVVTEGAGSYYHLNHNELVALLVQRESELERQKLEYDRQKSLLAKREVELKKLKPQVKDLEDYIDTLLVRIMEQKPTLLQVRSKLK